MADPLYRDPSQPQASRARDLLGRMTLDEKLAQLSGVWASALITDGAFAAEQAAFVLEHGAGHVTRIGASTVLGPRQSAELVNEIQRFLLETTRLGIPAIIHEESCAGYCGKGATQFPQAIGLASTFEPELAERMGRVIREQLMAVGARQTLAPVLDVARDPRWGRVEETFGEDPYLVSRFGVAYVRGVQGTSLGEGVIATGKHFMGYGAPEGGLNWAPCQLPRRDLLERILPPFAAAIREAKLASIMNGYNEIDGVPCGASKELLTDLLRDELGFEGVVVADYFTVACLLSYHRIADDQSEAAARALEAGLDVELPARDCYGDPLKRALEAGRISMDLVDVSVHRVLEQKLELGLFDHPYVRAERAPEVYDTKEQRELAREIGRRSMVLLKNDGDVLPLPETLSSVAVIGPNADSARHLQGDYSYPTHLEIVFGPVAEISGSAADHQAQSALLPGIAQGAVNLAEHFTDTVTIVDGIRRAVSEATTVLYARGCDVTGADRSGFDEAIAIASKADAAVVVVGGRSGLLPGCTSGEGTDAAGLELTGVQAELVRAVVETGTPTVVVLVNGRVLALGNIADVAPAILEAWLPGEEGGNAVADVLFGKASPGGKLPVTFPRSAGQQPLYYNHKPSGARAQFHGDYSDSPVTPLFPFGHGLSYGRFEYSDLEIEKTELLPDERLEAVVTVKNVGERAGDEVVQLYVRDRVGSVTRPVKELKGFCRLSLEPGQSRKIRFELDLAQLAFYDVEMRYVVEPGEVIVMVGASSEDIRAQTTVRIIGSPRTLSPHDARPTSAQVE